MDKKLIREGLELATPEELESLMSKAIDDSSAEITVELYKESLRKCLSEIKQLQTTIVKLQRKEIKMRDEIAAKIYMQIYTDVPSAERAAEDAYVAADSFLRIRESNLNTELTLLEDIKFFIKNHPNDADLGKKIREQFGNQKEK